MTFREDAMAVTFRTFSSPTKYERKVDFKKLEFIYAGIAECAQALSRGPEKLEILEAGCGDGSISMSLATLGASVSAFDIDEGLVAGLRIELEKRGISNVVLTCQNAYQFHSDTRFDIVIASEVLEHVDYPEAVVRNLKEHLRVGGYFIVTIPNGFGPWELGNRIRRMLGSRKNAKGECGHHHVQFFTLREFRSLMASHGLEQLKFAKSDALSGLSYAAAKNRFVATVDLFLANVMPSWFSSGWYFVFRNIDQAGR